MSMPTIERNYGAWGVYGAPDAACPTVGELETIVLRELGGGPLQSIPTPPPVMQRGAANTIGANLRLAYYYAVAARYLEGQEIGTSWGVDASSQAKGWAQWYYGQAKAAAGARWVPATRLMGFGLGNPEEIAAMFVKGAKWLEGYRAKDTKGGLTILAMQLRSLGAPERTRLVQQQCGGDTVGPDTGGGSGGGNPLKTLKALGIGGAIVGGVLVLGMGYLVLRKR